MVLRAVAAVLDKLARALFRMVLVVTVVMVFNGLVVLALITVAVVVGVHLLAQLLVQAVWAAAALATKMAAAEAHPAHRALLILEVVVEAIEALLALTPVLRGVLVWLLFAMQIHTMLQLLQQDRLPLLTRAGIGITHLLAPVQLRSNHGNIPLSI
jgi:hypothetical protein